MFKYHPQDLISGNHNYCYQLIRKTYRYSISSVRLIFGYWPCWMLLVRSSVTRLGDLLDFEQIFKACGNNKFAQISYILSQFL